MAEVSRDGGGPRPRVTVLMATYNGMAEGGAWLDEQVDSVLAQTGVEVRLVVSDDASSDGTRSHLEARAAVDPRISVLPQREGKPGVTGNFLHLFTTHVPDGSFVAFTDQDDVWHRDKLSGQLALMRAKGACVVSSNVTAFESLPGGAVGERRLIRKSQPQRAWDFLFEAAGPGSTYLFSPAAHAALVEAVSRLDYSEIGVHDWYLYALARARGLPWVIGEEPTLEYRQHGGNVQGANSGAGARDARMAKLRNGFYRRQFILTARAALAVGTFEPRRRRELEAILGELEDQGLAARLRFSMRWPHIRRDRVEGIKLAAARVLGVW
ncbi:glycosyltransferase [Schaalia meyeri]|uniref:glycosyltransferase n=1 Tax=Schaalia meyeri TaxID=52773 RepID=UPI00255AC0EE|nr:glycosyltransferase [Schaalia meyeri]